MFYYYKYRQPVPTIKEEMTSKNIHITFTNVHVSMYKPNMRNATSHLPTKCHNVIKKCHTVTEKCHAMTYGDYEFKKKMQPQSAGYVKVKLIADTLSEPTSKR